jgi:hypothetical protein
VGGVKPDRGIAENGSFGTAEAARLRQRKLSPVRQFQFPEDLEDHRQ